MSAPTIECPDCDRPTPVTRLLLWPGTAMLVCPACYAARYYAHIKRKS